MQLLSYKRILSYNLTCCNFGLGLGSSLLNISYMEEVPLASELEPTHA